MPHNGAEYWTTRLGLPVKTRWRPWTLDGGMRMGGYVTRYATPKAFDFLSVRGSGHMVPQFRPRAALHLLGAAWTFRLELRNFLSPPGEAPSGARVLYVPCPGGQMRFHILYDEVSRLYWLLASVATESMIP